MNFLEAHKTVHEYIDVFANGNFRADAISLKSITFYCENWQDKLIEASQIFVSHCILWNTRPLEAIDQYFALLRFNNSFIPDDEYQNTQKLWAIIEKDCNSKIYGKIFKNKVANAKKEYGEFSELHKYKPYRRDDVVNVYNHMTDYKNSIYLPEFRKKETPFSELVFQYCLETYKSAGINYSNHDDVYFYSFDQMRKWMINVEMKHYFAAFEQYLMHNQ